MLAALGMLAALAVVVAACKFKLGAVLYDFSFTNTSVSGAGAEAGAGAGAEAGAGAGAEFLFLALLNSSLISTWISLGAFVSIIYFLEIVSKYL